MAPFLPAWLTQRTNSDTNPNTNSNEKQRQRTRPTAYLDGLRGFAALVVYWGHHELWAHEGAGVGKAFELAYGYDNKYYFACLPGVRTIFAGGHFAVSVFFVLSGYVLSMKPLGCIQDGDYAELGKNLSSAVFRRWFRLYIPVICTTFGYLTFLHLFKIRTIPELQGSYRSELWSWYELPCLVDTRRVSRLSGGLHRCARFCKVSPQRPADRRGRAGRIPFVHCGWGALCHVCCWHAPPRSRSPRHAQRLARLFPPPGALQVRDDDWTLLREPLPRRGPIAYG